MSTTWRKLREKRFREEYATAMLKRMIPYQTRAIRKKRGWSQERLAEEANVTQGVISRAEDPDYGNLTLTTIGRIAAGFDLAAIIRLVPFNELIRYGENTSEKEFAELPTFPQEDRPKEERRESKEMNTKGIGGAGEIDNGGFGSKSWPPPRGQAEGMGMPL